MKCKSGKHSCLSVDSALKCCNGWKRVLVISPPESLEGCDSIQFEASTGSRFGFKWVRDDQKLLRLLEVR